jgi:RNA polymerase sigma factor (TIGR02999 family)
MVEGAHLRIDQVTDSQTFDAEDAGPDTGRSRDPDALFDTVYARLKEMAHWQLARQERNTLDTTALVHELYLRVDAQDGIRFEHRGQFLAYASRAMRNLLINHARDRLRQRAGGDWMRVTLTGENIQLAIDSAEQALSLDSALLELEKASERAARVVEMRYFGGLTLEETAAALGVTRRTADRDWRFARAFLNNLLG